MYCGMGFDEQGLVMHRYGLERRRNELANKSKLYVRVKNDRNIVTFYTSDNGTDWRKFDVQMEVSGYHHNVAYDFLSLKPGIYSAGTGETRFRNLRYQAL
jgi:beta-xylosidase